MFGRNEIVGKKHFADAKGRLLITSIFTTLQGEGMYAGQPAIFVRLAKCNLACGFCDTFFDQGDWFEVVDLAKTIERLAEQHYPGEPERMGVVITGGEPMLQDALTDLTWLISDRYKFVQIESNGTLLVNDLDHRVTLCVSPKCIEQNGKPLRYTAPNRSAIVRADFLKFVVSAEPTSPYHKIPDWAIEWMRTTKRPVYVSPMNVYAKLPAKAARFVTTSGQLEGVSLEQRNAEEVISFWELGLLDMEQNRRNHEYAARYVLEQGLTLSLQMHLFASIA